MAVMSMVATAMALPWPALLLLGIGGRWLLGRSRGLLLAGVEAADDLVGQVEVRFGEYHASTLVEHHGEVFGRRDLADDPLQALHDGRGGFLFLARQVLLVAHVRLLNLADPLLQLILFLANRLGGQQGALLVQVLDGLLDLFLLLVELFLLLVEVLLEVCAGLAAVLGFIERAPQIHVAELDFLGAQGPSEQGQKNGSEQCNANHEGHLRLSQRTDIDTTKVPADLASKAMKGFQRVRFQSTLGLVSCGWLHGSHGFRPWNRPHNLTPVPSRHPKPWWRWSIPDATCARPYDAHWRRRTGPTRFPRAPTSLSRSTWAGTSSSQAPSPRRWWWKPSSRPFVRMSARSMSSKPIRYWKTSSEPFIQAAWPTFADGPAPRG